MEERRKTILPGLVVSKEAAAFLKGIMFTNQDVDAGMFVGRPDGKVRVVLGGVNSMKLDWIVSILTFVDRVTSKDDEQV